MKKGNLYRLATHYSNFSRFDNQIDICTFMRYVMKGAWIALVITLTSAVALIPVVVTATYCIAAAMYHAADTTNDEFTAVCFSVTIIYVVLIIFALCAAWFDNYKEKRNYRRQQELLLREQNIIVPEKQPNAFALWYKSFKEKTCFIIKFEE